MSDNIVLSQKCPYCGSTVGDNHDCEHSPFSVWCKECNDVVSKKGPHACGKLTRFEVLKIVREELANRDVSDRHLAAGANQ